MDEANLRITHVAIKRRAPRRSHRPERRHMNALDRTPSTLCGANDPEQRAGIIAEIPLHDPAGERAVDAAEQAIAPPKEGVQKAASLAGNGPEPPAGVSVLLAQ